MVVWSIQIPFNCDVIHIQNDAFKLTEQKEIVLEKNQQQKDVFYLTLVPFFSKRVRKINSHSMATENFDLIVKLTKRF